MSKKKPKPSFDDVGQPLALTEVEMLRLSRAQETQRAALAEQTLLQAERAALLAQIDPQGRLRAIDTEIGKRKAELARAKDDNAQAVAGIEARLGIRLAEYSFDDVTGTLHHLGPVAAKEG
jgi:hypothetical protein